MLSVNRCGVMVGRFLHFLFPEVCIVCGRLLLVSGCGCCQDCRNGFDTFSDPAAAAHALVQTIRSHFQGRSVFDHACCRYLFHQRSLLQKALHTMKYHGVYALAIDFGRELGLWSRAVLPPEGVDCLVPVPLHRLKHVERSFNQAEKIAVGVGELYGKPVRTDLLERQRYTPTQTGLSAKARRKNLDGAFRTLSADMPARVLLVDDVVTTGATAMAAAEALLQGGVGSVSLVALALAAKE